jgi:hypothetical protein
MSLNSTEIDWSECIILFNSLVRSIEYLREHIESDDINDDDLYDAEEELNDYATLLARLRDRYVGIQDKGELSESMKKKLLLIC